MPGIEPFAHALDGPLLVVTVGDFLLYCEINDLSPRFTARHYEFEIFLGMERK